MSAKTPRTGSRILIGRGTRHTEALLLAELEADLDRLGSSLLSRPALLVVPSQSLRLHLLTTLAERRPAVAGLWCRTLYGLAAELTRQAGMPLPGRLDPLMLIARRLSREEPSLQRSFEHLVDGYRSGVATVSDLMDAAFDAAHAEALDEALAGEGPAVAGRQSLERARAVVRVAARSAEALDRHSLVRRPAVVLRAAELVRGGSPAQFAPSAVHIYGFADATGVATDLIEALLTRHPATLYLDRPADPADVEAAPAGTLYGRRFRERIFARVSPGEEADSAGEGAPPARLRAFRALGAAAEAREVARRLRALLDAGARPERMGIVARRLGPYLTPLRVQLRRYGVPFSGLGAGGPTTPAGRTTGALLELLVDGRRATIERWLDARQRSLAGTPSFDLRLALHSLGAARLEELAAMPLDRRIRGQRVPLPVRLGFDQETLAGGGGKDTESGAAEQRVLLRRRSVAASVVRQAAEQAGELCRRFDRWSAEAPLRRHFEELRDLLRGALEWSDDHPLTVEIDRQLEAGLVGLEEAVVNREELLLVLRELLGEVGREKLGGDGAGVQVLDATEARGRTFDHLFLIGLNGGLFPRTAREDPLLGDSLRRVLARTGHSVLPDLPLKSEATDEERYLFAQLLSSAPAVTLCWQQVDDDNGARTVSPLVERLRWSGAAALEAEPPLVRPAHATRGGDVRDAGDLPRPLLETAVEVALEGRRSDLEPLLALGLDELRPAAEIAAARLRVLDELDPPRRPPTLGPYLGMVGPALAGDDPRTDDSLYVTTLERMCGCPWQTLLTRLLRLEPLPDPLETLPEISQLLVGNVVHRVAEVIVERQLGKPEDDGMPPPGRLALPIAWPDDAELDRILLAAAERALAESGVTLPGFPRVVALAVRPYLDQLREADWPDGGRVSVLGAERRHRIEIPGDLPPRHLAFRVDRIDGPHEEPRYTDYKTGRGTISKTPGSLRRKLLDDVRSGLRLQVPAYALAGKGTGRYLFLHPEFTGVREVSVDATDADVVAAFTHALAASLTAWRHGAFPPRVVRADRDKEPSRCQWCEVSQACLRGDSGIRRRLRQWAGRHPEETESEVEAAARTLWRLPLEEAER